MYLGVAGAGDSGDAGVFGVAGGAFEVPGVSVTVFALLYFSDNRVERLIDGGGGGGIIWPSGRCSGCCSGDRSWCGCDRICS